MNWADELKDRILTSHPAAVVAEDGKRLRVNLGVVWIEVVPRSRYLEVVEWRTGDESCKTTRFETADDAGARVLEVLHADWRARQAPRTSPGGPSSSGGGGDGCDAVSGSYCEPSDDFDDDGGDE